ncbi:flavin reductase family protein [Chloroflexota bacterium]
MKIDPNNLDVQYSHRLFAAIFVPRPILLISTISEYGIYNVAPFSSVAVVCLKPRLNGFEISTRRDGSKKDTLCNIEHSQEFVMNTVSENMLEAMNQTSADYPPEVDEFKDTGLTPVKAEMVKAPLVGESNINVECRVVQILEFGEAPRRSFFIIGEILLVHIKDELLDNGEIRTSQLSAIGRLGEDYYCRTNDMFVIKRAFNV